MTTLFSLSDSFICQSANQAEWSQLPWLERHRKSETVLFNLTFCSLFIALLSSCSFLCLSPETLSSNLLLGHWSTVPLLPDFHWLLWCCIIITEEGKLPLMRIFVLCFSKVTIQDSSTEGKETDFENNFWEYFALSVKTKPWTQRLVSQMRRSP